VQQAGQALSKFDARTLAPAVDVPTAFLVTTQDSGVPPVKQRAFADALRAEVFELHGDHFASMQMPSEFSDLTRRCLESVATRI
jgi:cephalosporin-C deacetylase-like acetyl esterase